MTEPELRKLFSSLAKMIVDSLPPNTAFVLLAAPDSDRHPHSLAQYIANCERSTCIQFMRETADRLERKEDVRR